VSRLTLMSCPRGHGGLSGGGPGRGDCCGLALGGAARHPGGGAELFFNTPVRQKFLKSVDAEQAQILSTLRGLALGYPQVHFTLSTPNADLAGRPRRPRVWWTGWPRSGTRNWRPSLPLAFSQGAWQVTVLTTEPDFNLASTRFQFPGERPGGGRPFLGAVLREVYAGPPAPGRTPGGGEPERAPRAVTSTSIPPKPKFRFHAPARSNPLS